MERVRERESDVVGPYLPGRLVCVSCFVPQEEGPSEADWADEPSEVAHLTDASFDPFIATHNSTLVMFYAPWYLRMFH